MSTHSRRVGAYVTLGAIVLACAGCSPSSSGTTGDQTAAGSLTPAGGSIEVGVPYDATLDFVRVVPPDPQAREFAAIVAKLPDVTDELVGEQSTPTLWVDTTEGIQTFDLVRIGTTGCELVVTVRRTRDREAAGPIDGTSPNCGSYEHGEPHITSFNSADGIVYGSVLDWTQLDAHSLGALTVELESADWSTVSP